MPHIDLLELPPFAGIPLGDVVSLIDAMAPKQWTLGQVVLAAGTAPEGLLVLTAGRVSVGQAGGPNAVRQAPLVAPVHAFFAQEPVATALYAQSTVSAFSLPAKTFERLLQEHHPALTRFCANLLALGAGLRGCPTLG